jgi:hypothetical protein
MLLVVRGGDPVSLSIPASMQNDASLSYDPARFNGPLVRGDHAVRFEPCGGDQASTQFNGAFLIADLGCLPVVIRWARGDERIRLPFGTGPCP